MKLFNEFKRHHYFFNHINIYISVMDKIIQQFLLMRIFHTYIYHRTHLLYTDQTTQTCELIR